MYEMCKGIILAFKNSVQGDWLEDQREVLRGEIYSDLTDLGNILLEGSAKGYEPAAVIFGVVLEDKLRKLCDKHQISIGPEEAINSINEKLYKTSVYDKTEMKRVGLLGDIRNDAAHARWDKLDKNKVEDFYRQVVNFLARYSH